MQIQVKIYFAGIRVTFVPPLYLLIEGGILTAFGGTPLKAVAQSRR